MTRKIRDLGRFERPCNDPEHLPPNHMLFSPGIWEHVCPSCGHRTEFIVQGPSWTSSNI